LVLDVSSSIIHIGVIIIVVVEVILLNYISKGEQAMESSSLPRRLRHPAGQLNSLGKDRLAHHHKVIIVGHFGEQMSSKCEAALLK
jgi:hypothetical protein